MQHEISNIDTFKCAVPALPAPSQSLVLPSLETPTARPESDHRARYDAAIANYKPRGFRLALMLSWLILLLGWLGSVYVAWRWL